MAAPQHGARPQPRAAPASDHITARARGGGVGGSERSMLLGHRRSVE